MSVHTRLINRSCPLPPDYRPICLIDAQIPFDALLSDPKRLLEPQTAYAARALFAHAASCQIHLYGISGYRSYKRQKELFTGSPYVAAPGTSEHQSGLALDLSCPEVQMKLEEGFARTAEGIWLAHHAPLYGFVLRYPKNKEHITQVPYEPWHIRYVTKPLASYLSLTGMTLEEYHSLQENIKEAL